MSGWIKLEKDLLLDPRVKRMANRLTIAGNASALQAVTLVIGGLAVLWVHADAHVRPDDTLDLGPDEINQLVGINGFCEVVPADWLEVVDANSVKLPGFHTHNGTEAKKKALTQKRVAAHRNAKALHGGNARVLPDQDQDQDQDQDSKNLLAAPPPTRVRRKTHHEEPDWMGQLKLVYPKRAGDQNWPRAVSAIRARIAEGHHPFQFIEGAKRYADFVRATGKEGTEYVKQAATFLGTGKAFMLPWTPPIKPESAMERIRRLNGLTPPKETFENDDEQSPAVVGAIR